jgi:tRNA dimethylallyltransferase
VAVVGPTGVGKSKLAIRIALEFGGEIINGDSRQIYRLMNIGTAKPSLSEMNLVQHHLFDIVDPDAEYNLAQYQQDSNLAISSILKRQKLPVLVGGSGQYILGLLEGWQIPRISPDVELRKRFEQQAAEKPDELYIQLQTLDPDAALNIDRRNIRRVIRALEVCTQSGGLFSQLRTKDPPAYQTLFIGLTMERDALYRRTDCRVEEMFSQGLVDETQKLLRLGYSENLPSMSSIGYKQVAQLLRHEITEKDAIAKIKTETHRYIRHQYAWFKLKDERIKWFNANQDIWTAVSQTVNQFLKG